MNLLMSSVLDIMFVVFWSVVCLVNYFLQLIFKRNVNAFLLNANVDPPAQHEMIFFISRKLLELATSKFYHKLACNSLTFPPEMTS